MASVTELLLANEAKKSPFLKMMEGMAGGFGEAQNQRYSNAIKLVEAEQQRIRNEQVTKAQQAFDAKLKQYEEQQTKAKFNATTGVQPTLTPGQKIKARHVMTGGVPSVELIDSEEKTVDPLDVEYKQTRIDYIKNRADAVTEQQEERDYKRRERRNAERTRVIDRFNADPSVKKSQQMIDGSKTIEELALSDNPIAAGAIPTFMARASGEVGNLSEADKAPFGGSRAILERLEASAMQAATGKLTDDNRRFIVELANLMREKGQSNIADLAKKRARQYSLGSDFLSEGDVLNTLVPEGVGEQTEQPRSAVPTKNVVPSVGETFNGEKVIGVKRIK